MEGAGQISVEGKPAIYELQAYNKEGSADAKFGAKLVGGFFENGLGDSVDDDVDRLELYEEADDSLPLDDDGVLRASLEFNVDGEELETSVDGDVLSIAVDGEDGRGEDLANDSTDENVGDEQVETLSLLPAFDDKSRGSICCSLILFCVSNMIFYHGYNLILNVCCLYEGQSKTKFFPPNSEAT